MPRVLVTGTSSGLGRGVAERLLDLGWQVIGTVRDTSAAADLPFETVALDVTDEQAVTSLGHEVMSRWGQLDALVNNAGALSFRCRVSPARLATLCSAHTTPRSSPLRV